MNPAMQPFRYLLIGIALVCLSSLPLFAKCSINNDGGGDSTEIPIIMNEGVGDGSNGPKNRAPIMVPIEAIYSHTLSSIIVCFSFDLGEVVITIENTISGERSQILTIAKEGVLPLPISLVPGSWRICFRLMSGSCYVGEFTLQ